MSNLPSGVQPGFPHSVWTVNELVDLIQSVLSGSSSNSFAGSVAASTLSASGVVKLTGLPISDPHVVGEVWANSHVLTVSAG